MRCLVPALGAGPALHFGRDPAQVGSALGGVGHLQGIGDGSLIGAAKRLERLFLERVGKLLAESVFDWKRYIQAPMRPL